MTHKNQQETSAFRVYYAGGIICYMALSILQYILFKKEKICKK